MSEIPGITLSVEAKELIINLVKLDTKVKEDKLQLFSQLLELWKLDLSTGSNVNNKFSTNRDFIKQVIIDSYSESDRNADKICRILERGESYTTNEGKILPSNKAEIDRAQRRKDTVIRRANRQFVSLQEEFNEFIDRKGIYLYKEKNNSN